MKEVLTLNSLIFGTIICKLRGCHNWVAIWKKSNKLDLVHCSTCGEIVLY